MGFFCVQDDVFILPFNIFYLDTHVLFLKDSKGAQFIFLLWYIAIVYAVSIMSVFMCLHFIGGDSTV